MKPKPGPTGGTAPGETPEAPETDPTPSPESDGGATAPAAPGEVFAIPSIPSSGCASSGVPPVLIPIYQRAAATYELGPQGAAVLAGINEIETAFGTNLNVSSAGAMGWMQFIPSSWDMYGVDANGDGVADPYNPEDAIFAAADYLSAAGMPEDTYGAIFAYNHADWYVADVLANAACYGGIGSAAGAFSLQPQLQELDCQLPAAWREKVPANYLRAFEDASTRYGLGRRGAARGPAVTQPGRPGPGARTRRKAVLSRQTRRAADGRRGSASDSHAARCAISTRLAMPSSTFPASEAVGSISSRSPTWRPIRFRSYWRPSTERFSEVAIRITESSCRTSRARCTPARPRLVRICHPRSIQDLGRLATARRRGADLAAARLAGSRPGDAGVRARQHQPRRGRHRRARASRADRQGKPA